MANTMTDRTSVAANSTSANVLSGKIFEFAPADGMVTLGLCAAAVGVFSTFVIGQTIVIDDQEINAQARMPILPDDTVVESPILWNERMSLKHRNSTAAPIITQTKLHYQEG